MVRRSRKPAENAAHREKGHLWMGASYAKLLRGPHGPGRQPPLRKVLEHHKGILACRVKGLLHLTRDKPAFAEKPLARDIVCGCVKNQCLHSNLPGPFLYLLDEKMADAAVPSGRFYGDGQHFRHDGKIELTLKSAEHDEPSWSLFRQGQNGSPWRPTQTSASPSLRRRHTGERPSCSDSGYNPHLRAWQDAR